MINLLVTVLPRRFNAELNGPRFLGTAVLLIPKVILTPGNAKLAIMNDVIPAAAPCGDADPCLPNSKVWCASAGLRVIFCLCRLSAN